MKQIVIAFILPFSLFAQSVTQLGSPTVTYITGTDTLLNPYDAGRGAHVADLDGDMKKKYGLHPTRMAEEFSVLKKQGWLHRIRLGFS